jgi:hypothetical protein
MNLAGDVMTEVVLGLLINDKLDDKWVFWKLN